MENKTKTLLGLGAIAVALYFILKPKGSNAQTPPTQTPPTQTPVPDNTNPNREGQPCPLGEYTGIIKNGICVGTSNPYAILDSIENNDGYYRQADYSSDPHLGNPYVPCNFNDGDIVEVVGWLNTEFPDYKFSISLNGCMGHSLQSNLDLLDIEKSMTSATIQYKGKGRLKSARMVSDAVRRDENVPIIYT